ncbi:hypothetical protein PcaKH15_20600 [Parageobacillus caldoxylosilyticus]|nr:hypothetical protein PcaKH15_20600 [Parageobacillus caldoxylosilyticus]BDG39939.1 hypothetical protein PcaKH16_20780 [Parageobacillus caldoxylosilyticus]
MGDHCRYRIAQHLFPAYFDRLHGSQEVGMFLIHMFFAVIGIPASLPLIIQHAPLLLVFALIIVVINLAISLALGKWFKYDLEDILLASNANIGGATTAAALAIAKGWEGLIGPILIVGTVGYIIGNYVGTIIGIGLPHLYKRGAFGQMPKGRFARMQNSQPERQMKAFGLAVFASVRRPPAIRNDHRAVDET